MAKYLLGAVKSTANVAAKSKIAEVAIYCALRTGQSVRFITGFALGTSTQVIKSTLGEETTEKFLQAVENGENSAWDFLLKTIPIGQVSHHHFQR